MSFLYHRKDDISAYQLRDFNEILEEHEMNHEFVIDELMTIIRQPTSKYDLTTKYYANKLLTYTRTEYMRSKWENEIKSSKKQTVEKLSLFVQQWLHPDRYITNSRIDALLEHLKDITVEFIRQHYPQNCLCNATTAQFQYWKTHNFLDNYSKVDSMEVMTAVDVTLFHELQFSVMADQYCTIEHYTMEYVLETRTGSNLAMAFVYNALTRRLGLTTRIAPRGMGFLVLWESETIRRKWGDERIENVPNQGNRLKRNNRSLEILTYLLSKLEIIHRRNNCFPCLRLGWEFHQMIKPKQKSKTLELVNYYYFRYMDGIELIHFIRTNLQKFQRNFDFTRAVNLLENQTLTDTQQWHFISPTPKVRVSRLKYAVGMIKSFTFHQITYKCVIIGWDIFFNRQVYLYLARIYPYSTVQSNRRKNNITQPFYTVLSEDGRTYYVAEDLLLTILPTEIPNDNIGRFFKQFNNTHYVPNLETTKSYPEDLEILLNSVIPEAREVGGANVNAV